MKYPQGGKFAKGKENEQRMHEIKLFFMKYNCVAGRQQWFKSW